MTTRPELATEGNWLAGLAAFALFGVMAAVFLTASFEAPAGFPADQSIVENIGYAMFNLDGQLTIPSEGFLIAFETIDVILVAALVAAVMLARREDGSVRSIMADGGRHISESLRDDKGGED